MSKEYCPITDEYSAKQAKLQREGLQRAIESLEECKEYIFKMLKKHNCKDEDITFWLLSEIKDLKDVNE